MSQPLLEERLEIHPGAGTLFMKDAAFCGGGWGNQCQTATPCIRNAKVLGWQWWSLCLLSSHDCWETAEEVS